MKKLLIGVVVALSLAGVSAYAGFLDDAQKAAGDATKKTVEKNTPSEVKGATGAASGISPDQQRANECTKYTWEDQDKGDKEGYHANKTLPRGPWESRLKSRYKKCIWKGNSLHCGTWYGKSCADVVLNCSSGCFIEARCYDNAKDRDANATCPMNVPEGLK